jgi:hypothetical protein
MFFQNITDRFNGAPIARGGGNAQMFFHNGIGTGFADPPDAQCEPANYDNH